MVSLVGKLNFLKCGGKFKLREDPVFKRLFFRIPSRYCFSSRYHQLSCILPVVSVYRQKMRYRLQ